jgi:tyrosine aminotransferase
MALTVHAHSTTQPEKEWEVDLEQMSSLVDERTKVILVNNPSNPCGSVFSREHIAAILEIAEKHQLPIISDEVYYDMVFPSSGWPLCRLAPASGASV